MAWWSFDRRGGVADEVGDGVGDGLRRDRVRQQVWREVGTGLGGVEQLRRDGVHPDPERAQLQVQHAGEVDQGRLADGVGGHPGVSPSGHERT